MRESFVIDREKLYGFDYDNHMAMTWASQQENAEEAFAEVADKTDEVADVAEVAEAVEEISAKEAFFEFARGPQPTRPHPHPPRPHPPRPHPHPHPHPHPPIGHPPNNNFDPNSGSAPRFAPPAYTPQRAPGLRAVDPGAISRCLYSNTYVWLNNRQEFWFFPTFIGRRSIAGFRWMHRHWVYMGFSLNMIDSFFCGGR